MSVRISANMRSNVVLTLDDVNAFFGSRVVRMRLICA